MVIEIPRRVWTYRWYRGDRPLYEVDLQPRDLCACGNSEWCDNGWQLV